ncbi:hypothetical protein ANCDUO_24169 [Ancylostoma duodenale]|uniref:Spectrin repeat-containing domain protein n=1 Tax=Ancylostoma duodenale TaxID=51022 RepID=A0A0C2FB56_9BILA|nr:hypothetical protein ANCDUO_24169 [Ancylostoma duodenale]
MFLRQRLAGLQEGWEELQRMWDNRQHLLSQGLNLQMFLRDAKQAEVMLSQQENYLTKDEAPNSLEQAENMLKRHQVGVILSRLQAPLDDRRRQLERKKAAFQFGRDVEDEKLWIAERLALAHAKQLGENLPDCHRYETFECLRF